MYKVYLHRKKSNGQLFYVGISSNKRRPNRVDNRNPIWTNIYNKHGRTVEIIADNLSQKDACELEEFIIQECGRIDLGTGCLANCSNGGEINRGMIPYNKINNPTEICKVCKKVFILLRNKNGKIKSRLTCSSKCYKKAYKKKGFSKGITPWNKGRKTGKPAHNIKRIGKYNKEGILLCTFENEEEARIKENAGKGSIPKACRKERKTYRGFVWNYINYKNEILSE